MPIPYVVTRLRVEDARGELALLEALVADLRFYVDGLAPTWEQRAAPVPPYRAPPEDGEFHSFASSVEEPPPVDHHDASPRRVFVYPSQGWVRSSSRLRRFGSPEATNDNRPA